MNKLRKEDFDEYFGQDPFYSEADKKRLFQTIKQKQKQKKYFLPKVISALTAIVLLIITVQFFDFQKTAPNEEVAQLSKDVVNYFEEVVPGYHRAKELELVTPVDKVFTLKNNIIEDYNIRIEEIWYNSKGVFMFYSIGRVDGQPLQQTENPPELYELNISSEKTFTEDTLWFYNYDGKMYDNRFYNVAWSNPYMDVSPLKNVDENIDGTALVVMFGMELKAMMTGLPFQYNMEKEEELTKSIPLNTNSSFGEFDIKYEEIVLGLVENQLKLTFDSEYIISYVAGIVETDNLENRKFEIYFSNGVEPNQYHIPFPSFKVDPKETLQVNVEEVNFISDDFFSFEVDVSPFHNNEEDSIENPNELLYEGYNSKIFLTELQWHNNGLTFGLSIEYDDEDEHILADIPSFHEGLQTLLKVENEKGIEVSERDYLHPFGVREGNKIYFTIDKSFILNSNRLYISLEKLVVSKMINDELKVTVK